MKRCVIYCIAIPLGILNQQAKAQDHKPFINLIIQNDIVYEKFVTAPNDTISLALDIYSRSKISQEKHPAIIFVHGGGFWEGDKRSELYIKMASAFAIHGYVAFSVNYRLKDKDTAYSKQVLDTCISDIMAALRWIQANSERLGIDTSKIFICGDSAGGAIVVNICYDPAYNAHFAGCIDLWGGLPGNRGWNAPIFSAALSRHVPPTCIIHGTNDQVVPYATSKQLANELTAKKIYNELHPLKNADHYPVQLAQYFIPVMLSFTDKTCSHE